MGVSKLLFFPGRKGGWEGGKKEGRKEEEAVQSKTTLNCRKVLFFHSMKLICVVGYYHLLLVTCHMIWQTKVFAGGVQLAGYQGETSTYTRGTFTFLSE